MPVAPGTTLGPYQILAAIGAGGMGEVYRARDTRLDREVAIKVLPQHLSSNSKFRERFEREARAISSLKHPNICILYDIGHEAGIDYLVLEYLEGETLAQRVERGPLPLEQVLTYGIQMADALERAHRQGVVHRDLKPGNVMLTKDGLKLLDFGLAKPMAGAALASSAFGAMTASHESKPLTAEGTIVGTFQYMAPEQLEGKDADPRSDLFAFGCVLYEMAAGKRPFDGKTQASVVASILASDPPPLSTVQPLTPPAFERVVKTCVAKDPEERWQTAHDVKLQLRWIAEGGSQAGVAAPVAHRRKNRERLAWASGVMLALLVAAGFLAYMRTRPREILQFVVMPPEKTNFNFRGIAGPPAMSPDGRQVVYVATVQGQVGNRSLWLRALDSVDSRPLAATEGAAYPFWSPDGRFIGFFAGGKLKKYEVATGVILPISDVAEGRGGTWNEAGVILFGTRDGVLYRTTAGGGADATPVTELDKQITQTSHRFPYFMPDGEHFIYVAQAPETRVFFASLKEPKQAAMLGDLSSNVAFLDGHLIYARESTLLAQPFDPVKGTLSGEATAIAEQVQSDPQFNFSVFSSSKNGVLAFQSGAVDVGTKLLLLDRAGKEQLLDTEPAMIESLALSPANGRLALTIREAGGSRADIWSLQPSPGGQKSRFTFDQQSCCPVFSPDGSRLAYATSVQKGANSTTLRIKPASGMGSEQLLLQAPEELYPTSWSPDGRYLLIEKHQVSPKNKWEIWVVPTVAGQAPFLLLKSDVDTRSPTVSPDGKWMAFAGRDSGRYEIYVVPFHPDPSDSNPRGKWQVSSGGAFSPAWSKDGKELFYNNSSYTTLISTNITGKGDSFESSAPKPMFDLNPHPVFNNFYVPTTDGQHFYLSVYSQGSAAPFTVTINWTEKLKH